MSLQSVTKSWKSYTQRWFCLVSGVDLFSYVFRVFPAPVASRDVCSCGLTGRRSLCFVSTQLAGVQAHRIAVLQSVFCVC